MTDTSNLGKKRRLFYFDEAENAWCPVSGLLVENIVPVNLLDDGETMKILFECVYMTDEEFANIQEA